MYRHELIDQNTLQSVHMGQITHDDARWLKAQMAPKRKRSMITLLICVAVLASVTLLTALSASGVTWLQGMNDWPVFILLLIPLFLFGSIIVGIYHLISFAISSTYMDALKRCHPESVTRAHPLYNLFTLKPNLWILGQISQKEFTASEARGLQNIAEAARRRAIHWTAICAVLMIILMAFPALIDQAMTLTNDRSEPILLGFRIVMWTLAVVVAISIFLFLARIRTAKHYISILCDYVPANDDSNMPRSPLNEVDSLPMPEEFFYQLFDFLDEKLEEQVCNHTLDITMEFLEENGIPTNHVIEWLKKHGGYCDCEVLLNVEEFFDK